MAAEPFEATVGSEGSGTFIEVALDVSAIFGRVRAPVVVTVNGSALDAAGARAAFDAHAFSHRGEWVEWVAEGKRPETRERRVRRVVERGLARG